jgi:hypothetical protein
MKPEPITTTGSPSGRRACSSRRWSRLRSTRTPGSSAPGTGSRVGSAPVASTQCPYVSSRPPASATVRASASSATARPPINRTSCSASHLSPASGNSASSCSPRNSSFVSGGRR